MIGDTVEISAFAHHCHRNEEGNTAPLLDCAGQRCAAPVRHKTGDLPGQPLGQDAVVPQAGKLAVQVPPPAALRRHMSRDPPAPGLSDTGMADAGLFPMAHLASALKNFLHAITVACPEAAVQTPSSIWHAAP